MRFDELDARQRAREAYHGLAVPEGQWIIVRVDGRAFTAFTKAHYAKPFDHRFGDAMAASAETLLQEFDAVYAYTQSDEISVLLPRTASLFGRGVEKLVSVTAATASVAFSATTGHRAVFDSRLWTGETTEDVVDYFSWRQADATRNALNTCVYWDLIGQGMSARQAQRRIGGLGRAAKEDLLAAGGGARFDERPGWQRTGVGVWTERYEKQSYDPRAGAEVTALRRRVRRETELPVGEGYRELVRRLAAER